MIRCERKLEINASQDAIWSVVGRFMHIDDFAPLISSVDALTDAKTGIGAKRRCHFDNGGSVAEEVTAWEENRRYQVRLSEMASMPLHEANAEITLTPTDDHRTIVKWSMDYRVKYGPIGWLLGQTVMKSMMGKVLDGNLSGLAQKVQSNPTMST